MRANEIVVYALTMPTENATVAIYSNSVEAELALRGLCNAGFSTEGVSVAGKDGEAEESVACYYRAGGGVRYWGRTGEFWNNVWEMLSGWAFLNIPGVGPVLVAGPLANWIVTGLENAAIFMGLSALGAALYSIGISKDAIAECEAALASGKVLVIAHGPADQVARAKRLLRAGELEGRG